MVGEKQQGPRRKRSPVYAGIDWPLLHSNVLAKGELHLVRRDKGRRAWSFFVLCAGSRRSDPRFLITGRDADRYGSLWVYDGREPVVVVSPPTQADTVLPKHPYGLVPLVQAGSYRRIVLRP